MTSGYTPYFIGPMKVGLERDLDSYLIPEDAFPTLENAYLWRGRIYKKGGIASLNVNEPSRLGVRSESIATRGAPPQVVAGILAYFPIEPGSLIITDGITTFTDNGVGDMIATAGLGTNGTIDYTTGAYSVQFDGVNAGATVTASYIVKVGANSPVMGLRTFQLETTNQEDLIGFDLTSAYKFNKTTSLFEHLKFYKKSVAPGPVQTTNNVVAWTGTNSDFFYTTNFCNAMFTTNGIKGQHFYNITNITNTNPAVVTTSVATNFVAGDVVAFTNIGGKTYLNGQTGLITVVAGANITVALDATAGAYTAGTGIAYEVTKSSTLITPNDGIRWMDDTYGFVNYQPPIDNADVGRPTILQGCLLLFPYKNYLVALSTIEYNTNTATSSAHRQRARWSRKIDNIFSSPFYASPLPDGYPGPVDPNAWIGNVPGFGTYTDAATGEQIVAAEFIKDTLVVYFEFSTWKLTFTGDPVTPFIWEKINTEIGASGTFSTVPFDRNILSVGVNGVDACDSVNVARIDRIIPDEVFTFQASQSGQKRVHGIRDFYGEFSYWIYPTIGENDEYIITFPNRMLVYNYVDPSFSIFKNSFTALGYLNVVNNLTWATATLAWQKANFPWNSFTQQIGFPLVVAGNPQGFVFKLQEADGSSITGNARSLVIQAITNADPSVFTVPNHNLQEGDFVKIVDDVGSTGVDGEIFKVGPNPTANTFSLVDDAGDNLIIAAYTYGAFIAVQDNFIVKTKNLNPYFQDGRSVQMGYIDLYLNNVADDDTTSISVKIFRDDDPDTAIKELEVSLNDESNADNTKFWKRVYVNSQAEFLGLQITYADEQMFEDTDDLVEIHGMIPWMKPSGRLLQ